MFQLQKKKKNRNKTTTTAARKNELKYYPVPEGSTCTAEANLEILPLK